jgi:microcystin-dependent protein
MADVTISQLTAGTPTGTGVIPYSDGATTCKVTVDQLLALQSGVPSGFIGLWSGAANAIPTGWLLCNGTSGTPNLVDRFVLGAGTSTPAVGATGGSKDAVVVSHTHTATDSGHTHSFTGQSGVAGGSYPTQTAVLVPSGSIGTTTGRANITVASAGQSGTNANMPPYYALCYIMKT